MKTLPEIIRKINDHAEQEGIRYKEHTYYETKKIGITKWIDNDPHTKQFENEEQAIKHMENEWELIKNEGIPTHKENKNKNG